MTAEAVSAPTVFRGTGRRKTSVARVRLIDGGGSYTINGKPMEQYFVELREQVIAEAALRVTETLGKVDIIVKTTGGGFSAQAGAVLLGVARALKRYNPDFDRILRDSGYLTRDSRMKERKKYGRAAARKQFQFSKR